MFLAAPEKDFVIKSSIPATSFMQKRISLYLHKKDAEQKGHKKNRLFLYCFYAVPIVHTILMHNQSIFLVLMVLQN